MFRIERILHFHSRFSDFNLQLLLALFTPEISFLKVSLPHSNTCQVPRPLPFPPLFYVSRYTNIYKIYVYTFNKHNL